MNTERKPRLNLYNWAVTWLAGALVILVLVYLIVTVWRAI